ncbi:MAG TPA: hypothetical protein VHT53_09165 [Candidatus Elarobacter sp.]|jgi:hypothetical protein|nr:hypothetical protein [Candidatus Elarobacter sp.]
MRVPAIAASLAAALAVFSPAATQPALASGPTVAVRNVESRNSVNGCGRFRFDADIVTADWPPGQPHVVRYHWARTGHSWKMRTITMDASGRKHVRAELNPREATRGFAWVHVYSPVNLRSAKVGFSNPNC